MALNPNIALGAQSPTQAMNPLAMLAQILQIQQMGQQGKLAELKAQHEQAMLPLQMQKMEAEIRNIPAQEEQRRAAADAARLKLMGDLQQQQARAGLADYFDPTKNVHYKPDAPLSIFGSEQDALTAALEHQKKFAHLPEDQRPVFRGTGNANRLQSLLAQADSPAFVRAQTQAMNRPPERPQVVGPGAALVSGGQVVHERPFAPRAEPAPTVRIVPDGKGGYWYQDLRNPGVNLAPAPNPTINPANNNANALARQFAAHPSVKAYDVAAPGVRYAASYISNIPKTGATAADDAALTKLFLAMTHPKGDQISNLDLRQLSQLPDLEDRVKVAISGFISGRTLPNEMRTQFWNVISNKFKYLDQERAKKRREIEERARAMGADTTAIFGEQ